VFRLTTTGCRDARRYNALAVQDDGKLVAAGVLPDRASALSQVAVARLDANGSPDVSFGRGGLIAVVTAPYEAAAQAVAISTTQVALDRYRGGSFSRWIGTPVSISVVHSVFSILASVAFPPSSCAGRRTTAGRDER
jgi:hypothetical protein